jgi:hypothetical protein
MYRCLAYVGKYGKVTVNLLRTEPRSIQDIWRMCPDNHRFAIVENDEGFALVDLFAINLNKRGETWVDPDKIIPQPHYETALVRACMMYST